jgi:hypothetical protein
VALAGIPHLILGATQIDDWVQQRDAIQVRRRMPLMKTSPLLLQSLREAVGWGSNAVNLATAAG